MVVEACIERVDIQGRALAFKVTCRDEAGLVGEGQHLRAIIDLKRFERRLAAKTVGDATT